MAKKSICGAEVVPDPAGYLNDPESPYIVGITRRPTRESDWWPYEAPFFKNAYKASSGDFLEGTDYT